MPLIAPILNALERKKREFEIAREFTSFKDDTKHDLDMRINGVASKRGSTGKQLVGYLGHCRTRNIKRGRYTGDKSRSGLKRIAKDAG